jgi:transcriptional regulator with XRE-family HTH domain
MNNLGQKIKQLRNERDLSLERLAQNINVAKSMLWKYEKDQATPSADIIKRIAAFFGVSTDYLLFDNTEKENISKITDKQLLRQFEEVDKMETEKRELIKRLISMAINEDKIKKMVS